MIDSHLDRREWCEAATINEAEVANIYFQRSREHVYIAIEYTRSPSGIVDLYISPRRGTIYDLHASAKLGERRLTSNGFSQWKWWNNRGWTANVSRVDSFEKRTFLPTPVRVYQIGLSRFRSKVWLLRFELTAMGAKNETLRIIAYPHNTTAESTAGWLQLIID